VHKIIKKLKNVNQEFNSTFKAVWTTHIYQNRKTIIKAIIMCFIPFLYAFVALWAFFNPLGNINNLPIALVNNDISAAIEPKDARIINLHNLGLDGIKPNSLGAYEKKIDDLKINNEQKTFTIYYFNDAKTYQQHQNDQIFLTEILIDQAFTKEWHTYFSKVFDIIETQPLANIWSLINQIDNKPQIILQASYKINPILGEINDFALNIIKDNIFSKIFPVVVSDQIFNYWYDDATKSTPPNPDGWKRLEPTIKTFYDVLAILIPGMAVHENEFNANITTVNSNAQILVIRDLEHHYWINHSLTTPIAFVDFKINIEGQDKSPYGFGLGPYFICIGMWVGTLLLTFIFTRNRELPKSKFWANYLAKSAWMIIFGLIQATILTTSLLLLFNSVDLWIRCWQMYLYMFVIAIAFPLIIQAIAHMFRDHDVGRFLIVVLLILQLSSANGTFPVALEPRFFQIMYHVLPFSYVIKGLREILINPNPIIIFWSIGCLLIFIAILVPLSLLLNWIHDRRAIAKLEKIATKKIKLLGNKKIKRIEKANKK